MIVKTSSGSDHRLTRSPCPSSDGYEGTSPSSGDTQLLENDFRDQQRTLIRRIQLNSCSEFPSCSVIIPSLGHKLWVLECISAISRQSIFSDAIRRDCKVSCEIIIVQDGSVTERNHHLTTYEDPTFGEDLSHEAETLPRGVKLRVIELSKNKGRSTARNIGARFASGKILIFLDSRMLLDVHTLGEILVRHAACSDSAVLLGFKQNISEQDYFFHRHRIRRHHLRPAVLDGRSGDWKVRRELKSEHITSTEKLWWRDHTLKSTVNFMEETDWLRNMKGSEQVGVRSVGHFLSTALVTCSRYLFQSTGGFDEVMQDSWGLEDSLVGVRLFRKGGKLIPCPTASAFLLDQPAVEGDDRRQALMRNATYVAEQLARPASARPASSLDVPKANLPIRRQRKIDGQPFLPIRFMQPLPQTGIDFDYTPASSELFESYFLKLMTDCRDNKDLAFTTETQHLPFIGRTLGQQRTRHKDKLDASSSEFHLYKLRHRYNIWDELAKKHQVRIILDEQTLKSYFAIRNQNVTSGSEDYFDELGRYIQACRMLMLSRDFPGLLRLSETPVTESVFHAGDYELAYFNRLPSRIMRVRDTDRKGLIRTVGSAGQKRVEARWSQAKGSGAAEHLLAAVRDSLREQLLGRVLQRSNHLETVFLNRIGLGEWRCVAAESSPASNHGYQDAAIGSDGRQCWVVCDGVTPTSAITGDLERHRSAEVKEFVDKLATYIVGVVTESSAPISIVQCLLSANSWVSRIQ